MKISPNDPCPCGSGVKYKKCCRVLHSGNAAPTPEALMRSRYTAYALDIPAYIMETTHPDSPHYKDDKTEWRKEVEAFSHNVRFVGLQILNAEGDMVTFHATLFDGAEDISYTERSLFRLDNGRWKYVEAVE
jgi:SEC-C motif-containing protein